jgi:hypothetical protein
MRLSRLAILTALAGVLSAPMWAADKPLTPSADEYGRLCQRLNAVTGRSVEEIRTSLSSLSGKYIEIRGKVLGRAHGDLTTSGLVDMYLKCGDDSCFVACPPDVSELQPGRCVRMLVQVPQDASDIDDCAVKAVVEDPLGYERGKPAAGAGNSRRLEIGEAAYGVRDKAPDFGPAAPQGVGGARPSVPNNIAPGSALPPELRGMTSLSGKTAAQSVPQVRFASSTGRTYEQVVQIWTNWVRKYNPSLTVQQADLIVRWTIYHSANNHVDHRLVFAVMKYESDFDPTCVSHAGAMGLMQLMPCNVNDFKVSDPFDINQNIRGGVEHLAEFLRRYQGRSYYEQTVLALACYNAGPGAVAAHGGGVPPYAETEAYVRNVPALFAQLVKDGYP